MAGIAAYEDGEKMLAEWRKIAENFKKPSVSGCNPIDAVAAKIVPDSIQYITPTEFYKTADEAPKTVTLSDYFAREHAWSNVRPTEAHPQWFLDRIDQEQRLNAQHENEIAILHRALQMAKSKIARLEARLPQEAPAPSTGDKIANAFRFDKPLDGYGR